MQRSGHQVLPVMVFVIGLSLIDAATAAQNSAGNSASTAAKSSRTTSEDERSADAAIASRAAAKTGMAGRVTDSTSANGGARLEFFESRIRPVLVEHCYECHSGAASSVKGGLRLDSREGTLAGGDSGPAVVVGDPDQSLLVQAIRHSSFEMPPDRKLSDQIARDFETWIKDGAVDPRDGKAVTRRSQIDIMQGRQFWSFRPVVRPSIPSLAAETVQWCRNDIDVFIAERHARENISPTLDATPEQLIRRLHFVLTGLPPVAEQIDAFVAACQVDQDKAVGQLVDDLLQSRHFGERWGRHWLDVARFAESSGGGRSLMYPHAWRYRDYVIRSFNHDKPFPQFVREQIAGDLLPAENDAQRDDQLTGSGYLIMGAINFEQQDKEALRMDVIDEQIDSMGRTFLGMTLGCARCHDHKFDPIPASDYYALAGIFRSTHTLTPGNVSGYVTAALRTGFDSESLKKWQQQDQLLQARLAAAEQSHAGGDAKPSGEEILPDSLPGIVIDDTDAVFTGEWTPSTSLRPFVGQGYWHSGHQKKGVEVRYTVDLPHDGKYAVRLSHDYSHSRSSSVPVTIHHADGAATVLVDQTQRPNVDGVFAALGEFHFSASNPAVVVVDAANASAGYVIADAVQLIPVDQPPETPSSKLLLKDAAGEKQTMQDLRQQVATLRNQIKDHARLKPSQPVVMSVEDEANPADWHIHLRGDAHRRGAVVPRGFLTVATWPDQRLVMLSEGSPAAVAEIPDGQSGRLQLADWLADANNPLTTRVFVNRVWMHVMGEGLVRNPDNFGATGLPPTHPQLLDYLADSFAREDRYSTKQLIRRLCTSRTFRMSSMTSQADFQKDPDNLLMARANRRRVDAETLRDSMLQISGQLDLSISQGQTIGRLSTYDNGYQHEKYPLHARSVFVPFFRNAMLDLFFTFDGANPNTVTGKRTVSTLPAQSLYLMNSPFVSKQARLAAERLLRTASGDATAARPDQTELLANAAWRQTLGRRPSPAELAAIRSRVAQTTETTQATQSTPASGDDFERSVELWTEVFHALFGSVDFHHVD